MPDANAKVELTAIKEGDTLTYDFTGSSPQAELGVNCSYWATWGGLFAPIFPLPAWDVTWNEGVTRPIELIAPEGTIVNCIRPAPISIATVGTIQIVNNLSTLVLSKLFGASERHGRARHRGLARQPRARGDPRVHGGGRVLRRAADGHVLCAAGARAFADGVDLGGEIPNIVSRWANVESQELNTPIRYLFRLGRCPTPAAREVPRRRLPRVRVRPEPDERPDGARPLRQGHARTDEPRPVRRLPGCNVGYTTFRKGNVDELPDRLEALRGEERVEQSWGHVELDEGDIQYVRFMGGGGYGDPLDRDPSSCSETCSPASSRSSRHATSTGSSWTARRDVDATRARRAELRSERIGRELGLAERADVPRTGMRLSEYLQRKRRRRTVHLVRSRRPRRVPTGRTTLCCAGCSGARRPAPRRVGRVLPARGLLPRLRHAARHRARRRRRPHTHDRVNRWPGSLMEYVVGIDIGGTCTDCVVVDGDGNVTLGKAFSTPPDFSAGILDFARDRRRAARHRRRRAARAHAALPAFVDGGRERRGRRHARARGRDHDPRLRGHAFARERLRPLVGLTEDEKEPARHGQAAADRPSLLIVGIAERTDANGDVKAAATDDRDRAAVQALVAEGVEAIEVSTLWSFANP